jgi:hypothetical protein
MSLRALKGKLMTEVSPGTISNLLMMYQIMMYERPLAYLPCHHTSAVGFTSNVTCICIIHPFPSFLFKYDGSLSRRNRYQKIPEKKIIWIQDTCDVLGGGSMSSGYSIYRNFVGKAVYG